LSGWLSYLGIGAAEPQFATLLDKKLERIGGWAAVNGWGGAGPLQVIANSSDEQFRIPGTMKPHGVAVHPEVKQRVIVGWRSPVTAAVQIEGRIEGVHVGCSNGTLWSLQIWRGGTRQVLASGTSNAGQPTPIGPFDSIELRRGDVVSIVVAARDGNKDCDLTAVDLAIRSSDREWDLAKDVSADILAANPHAGEPVTGMPQLAFGHPEQGRYLVANVVWLFLIFGLLYYVMSAYALPQVAETLAARRARIDGDLEAAQVAVTHAR
jgi:hypothetical protein